MSNNVTVVNNGGYFDIFPDETVALSAESLLEVIGRLKGELGTDAHLYKPTHKFAVRVSGGTVEMAGYVRQMDDLFPDLPAENLEVPEIRYVSDGVAYVDPRLVLPVGVYVAFVNQMREHFGADSVFSLKDGQFIFNPNSYRDHIDKLMVEFCNPVFTNLSKFRAGTLDGLPWIELSGKDEVLSVERLADMEHVLLTPAPIVHSSGKHYDGRISFAIDTPAIVTPDDVKRLYAIARDIALALNIHPIGSFAYVFEEGLHTKFVPSPLTSR